MKNFLIIFVLFCSFLHSSSQRIAVNAEVYSEEGYVGTCKMEFLHTNDNNRIYALTSPYADIQEFGVHNKGCISTSDGEYGYRWWLTGAYYNGDGTIREYNLAIFDPNSNGGLNLFLKRCPPDRSSMSESKYMYVLSEEDSRKIKEVFIFGATDNLRVVKQGDIFGDGVHLNPNIQ